MNFRKFLIAKSPVKYRKRLVFEYLGQGNFERDIPNFDKDLIIREFKAEDIEKDSFLFDHRAVLIENLSTGYAGHIAFHKETGECAGYGWTAIGKPPANGIPVVPKNSAWLFGEYVREEYRGNGYQKVLQRERIKAIQAKNKLDIFIDVMADNFPAIKNIKRNGFVKKGAYYILIIGIRKYRFLHFVISYWPRLKYPRISF